MLKTAVDIEVKIDDKKYRVKVRKLTKKQRKELREYFGERLSKAIEIDAEISDTYRMIGFLEKAGDSKRLLEKLERLDELKAKRDEIREGISDEEFDEYNKMKFEMMVEGGDIEPLTKYGEEYGYFELVSAVEELYQKALKKK